MKREFVLAIAVALACTSLSAQKPEPLPKVPVFVTSESEAQGFTDPSKDRQDSIKDIEKKVRDSETLALVTKKEDALVLLEVIGRDTNRKVNGWTCRVRSGAEQEHSCRTAEGWRLHH